MARFRAATPMAPIPFDRHGVPGTIEIVEDFVGAAASGSFGDTTGTLEVFGTTAWWGAEIAGDADSDVDVVTGVPDHPGIIRLNTGGTTPADGDAASLQFGASSVAVQEDIVLDDNGVYVAAVVRIPDVDATVFEFGLGGQTPAVPNSSALDLVAICFDPEDADNVDDELFFCQVNGGGTDTEKIADKVPYVEGDWVLLEIAADSTSATFRITSEDNTQTIMLTAEDGVVMPTVALRPYFVVEAVGNAEESVDIDLFVMRYMRRDALVAGWLGA